MKFQNQIVLLTGAAGNLGRAVAQLFSEQGAQLVLLGRTLDMARFKLLSTSPIPLLLEVDLTDLTQVSNAAQTAIDRFGRIDILCNLAGSFQMGQAVHETTAESWSLLFDSNVKTVLLASAAVVPHMLAAGGGKVVNVGACAAQRGTTYMGAYAAAKSTVIRLTESMSAELCDRNINVNCVLPSIIDTPENRAAMPDTDASRWVAPQDLAKVILFLASSDAKAVHGAALPVTALS